MQGTNMYLTNKHAQDCPGTARTRTACHCEETQELRGALLRDSALCEETQELRRATLTDPAVADTTGTDLTTGTLGHTVTEGDVGHTVTRVLQATSLRTGGLQLKN